MSAAERVNNGAGQTHMNTIALIDTRLKNTWERASGRSSARMTLSGPRSGPHSKRTRRFKSGCEGSGVKDHVPTKIVTLKVRLGDGEHVNPGTHLFGGGGQVRAGDKV
jgi:hypothetical protein